MRLFRRDPVTPRQLLEGAALWLAPIALWIVSEGGAVGRWGYVIGLAAQPVWIVGHWRARQISMLAIACAYLVVWIKGVLLNFPELYR